MQTDKEFEDFFRERFNGLEETPPAGAWEKINNKIKPRRTYYREMAAVILLCLVSVFIYLGLQDQAGENRPETVMNQETGTNLQSQQTTPNASDIANPKAPENKNQVATSVPRTNSNQKPQTTEGTISENGTATSKTTIDQVKPEPEKGQLALVLKKKEKSENPAQETAKAQPLAVAATNSRSKESTSTIALTPEKRYALNGKNPEVKTAAKTETVNPFTRETETQVATRTALSLPDAKGIPAQDNTPASGNSETVADIETQTTKQIIARNTQAKPDTNILKTIPEALPDSLKILAGSDENQPQEKTDKPARWAITVSGTPTIISRRLIANRTDDKHLRFSEETKSRTPEDFGYDLHVAAHYNLKPQTTLDAGLVFSKLQGKVNYTVNSGGGTIVSQTIAPGTNAATVKVEQRYTSEEFAYSYTYSGLRVGLSQELMKSNATAMFVGGGMGLNMLMGQQAAIVKVSEPVPAVVTQPNVFRSLNTHLYLNAGLTKNILPGLSAIIAPAFTYYLNSSFRKEHSFEVKPYTLGINLGLRYQL